MTTASVQMEKKTYSNWKQCIYSSLKYRGNAAHFLLPLTLIRNPLWQSSSNPWYH